MCFKFLHKHQINFSISQIEADDCPNRPVGLQNPDCIPDSAFTANYDHGTFSPHMARINSGGGTRDIWVAGAVSDWIQVDLGQTYTVRAIGEKIEFSLK